VAGRHVPARHAAGRLWLAVEVGVASPSVERADVPPVLYALGAASARAA